MRFLALGFFVACGGGAVRLAVAGYFFDKDSAAAVDRAANGVECAEYAERLAAIDPELTRSALDRAIRWNPRSSAARIARGLEEENEGDFEGAAQELLRAAEVDRQYLPAWTLANFYFRRGDRQRFQEWAHRSAELIPGDVEPLLLLCDRVDPGNALAALPDEPKFEWAYFDLLIQENRLGDAERVAGKLAARRGPEDVRRLTGFTTRLIGAGEDAVAVAMGRILFPGAVQPVNGEFQNAPSGEGFDWRMPTVNGVTADWSAGRLTFRLAGRQPESCALLEQPMPVEAGPYRLRFEHSGDVRGIRWMLDSRESPELDVSSGWAAGERNFSAGRSGIAWLRLLYRRDVGVPEAEGKIEIRRVQWEARGAR